MFATQLLKYLRVSPALPLFVPIRAGGKALSDISRHLVASSAVIAEADELVTIGMRVKESAAAAKVGLIGNFTGPLDIECWFF